MLAAAERTSTPDLALLALDPALETERICTHLRDQVRQTLRKRGLVLGISGGVDSSVCAALAARAVGADNVLGLIMPESDSDPESRRLGMLVAERLGIRVAVEDIGPMLASMGCYERRDECIRELVPEYGPGWTCKVTIAQRVQQNGYAISWLVVRAPDGNTRRLRMPAHVYRGLIAATNMKQRTRKQIEYYHADRLNFAVLGTPNRLEHDQGFFVKNGDGAADVKPIAHLYKTQVYALAEFLEVPEAIRVRPPTTDTWSLSQTQEEFFFALPLAQMDVCLHALNTGLGAAEAARAAGLSEDAVRWAWEDIAAKRKATQYLHTPALLVEPMERAGG